MQPKNVTHIRKRQIELVLYIDKLRQQGRPNDIKHLLKRLSPKIKALEKKIRKFHVTYLSDVSYFSFPSIREERQIIDNVPWTRWNSAAGTPQPSREQIEENANNERALYTLKLRIKDIQTPYDDAMRELIYWNKKAGPLKPTPGFSPNAPGLTMEK